MKEENGANLSVGLVLCCGGIGLSDTGGVGERETHRETDRQTDREVKIEDP